MIIDVNKLESIDNIKVDLNDSTFIYFLFAIDKDTPRYSRLNGTYVPNPYGSIIMDHGFDIFNKHKRTLLYIGETTTGLRRIMEHWLADTTKQKSGIGRIFTHIRRVRRSHFIYDSVRLHYERIWVRKFLPKINKNANFTKRQLTILRNSNGKITPQEITRPYLLHYKDIIEAFEAWDKEDIHYLHHTLNITIQYNKLGMVVKRKAVEGYYRNNKKINFGRFITDIVMHFHPKMKQASSAYNKQIKILTQIFNPEAYQVKIKRDRLFHKNKYANNKKEIIAKTSAWRRLRTAEKKKNITNERSS